eukprot:m.182208 g.182208  ORF g.182208 m.182208 type:complete len:486 (+) comp25474_c0_seq1:957-2414(+)
MFSRLVVVLVGVFGCCVQGYFEPKLSGVDEYVKLRSHGESTLYALQASGQSYLDAAYFLDLHGSRYDHGFAFGYLLTAEIADSRERFFHSLLGNETALWDVVSAAALWQWNDYLGKQLPAEFKEELEGIKAGGIANGNPHIYDYVLVVLVLGNAPGDLKDFIYILIREFQNGAFAHLLELVSKLFPKIEKFEGFCSMFGAWGSRTLNGDLFAGRNLDWTTDTGINKYKLVTVYHPPNKTAHVTFGFAAMFGALAGMSAKGLTVHEANLEENEITFSGFPWLLRLRYIMENAVDSTTARALWAATNNTVGFNHMVGSQPDAELYKQGNYSGPGVATVMETMFNYTAYFTDNDDRETQAMDKGSHIGGPLKEAVWRTNNGYDPIIRQHFEWSQSPTSDSVTRYFIMRDAIEAYQTQGKKIGLYQAVNITAFTHVDIDCSTNKGSNILSVACAPNNMTAAVAWESRTGDAWRPACCSSYLSIDFSKWF